MKIVVTGASGLVGTHYLNITNGKYKFFCPGINEMDITNLSSVSHYLSTVSPDYLINFAAFTDTKAAELQRHDKHGSVWDTNVNGAKNLAQTCRDMGIFLIHISTDIIFPGKQSSKEVYFENDPYPTQTDKICWYGITKLQGEEMIRKILREYAVIRISYPFTGAAHQKKDILHSVLDLYKNNKMYPMFIDNTISPINIIKITDSINSVIAKRLSGIFHVSSHGAVSHYEFTKYIIEKYGGDTTIIKPALLSEFTKLSKVPRPLHITLDTKATEQKLNLKFGTWKENVDEAFDTLTF